MPSSSGRDAGKTLRQLKQWLRWQVWLQIYNDVEQKHIWQMAAAMAYYFLLSLFPALILLSAVVAFLPGQALFDQSINGLTRFLPPDSMSLVRGVLADTITLNRGAYFSFGFIGTIWAASACFSSSIEALNMAYGVQEDRPFWKTRALAVALALLIGTLLLIALSVLIVGPRFGEWLAARVDLSRFFVRLWPYIHWTVAIGFTILGIEALYLLAPNGKRQFRATLPGAALAVGFWLALSYGLGAYFRHFGTFDKNYGTLGAVIALMIWLYWGGFAVLLGAELNAQLANDRQGKSNGKRVPASKINQAA